MANREMLREIGYVASGNTPQNMRFYSMQQICADCVVIELGEEKFIYEVTSVDAYNSRMEDMELVRYIRPGEDYSKYTIYRASTKPLGIIKDGKLCSMKEWFVAPPGQVVREAGNKDISIVYGVEQGEGKQKIGSIIRHGQIPVWLDASTLLTTHMAMVGRSGQGKSNLAKILLKDLPTKYMVFTKVNEYANIKNAKVIGPKRVVADADINLLKKIFELNNSEVQYLRDYLKTKEYSGNIHSFELSEDIRQFFGTGLINHFQQLSMFETAVSERNAPLPKFVESLCKKLESISMDISFEKKEREESVSCVINMQNLSEKEEEIILYTYLAPILKKRRRCYENSEQSLPLNERIVIFIEEAHNYIPSTRTSFCKNVIQQIAREGRKLGIHLVLLSQRPRHIDPTALSQCGSIVAFHLTNPEDIDYLMKNANFYGDYYRNTISEHKVGECTIVSDYLMRAINCKVDLD